MSRFDVNKRGLKTAVYSVLEAQQNEQASVADAADLSNPQIISNAYTDYLLNGFDCSERNRLKAIGQFLTPEVVYSPMLDRISLEIKRQKKKAIRVIDPFCGDARLLCALLERLSALSSLVHIVVEAYDIDPVILKLAESNLRNSVEEFGCEVEVRLARRDSFVALEIDRESYDVCVTNPPWSSTKSLKPHAFKTASDYRRYQDYANAYSRLLSEEHPIVSKSKTFGRGAINLSRYGLALSLKLLNPSGLCGIVMPSSFSTDTSSESLRAFMFNSTALLEAHYYPAELKQFKGADQAAFTLALSKNSAGRSGVVYSHGSTGSSSYRVTPEFMEYSYANSYVIPLGYSDEEMDLITRLSSMETVGDCTDIHLGREVDETRISERLCIKSEYRFVKGFMVSCYRLNDGESWYYDDKSAQIPQTAMGEKVVWRDISRASQKKRVKATLLAAGFVAGNSLGVATATSGIALRTFLGVLNSRVFEFLASTVLTTNHVSAGSIKRLPYPKFSKSIATQLELLVNEMLLNPADMHRYDTIDACVAEAYGLDSREYEIIKKRTMISDLESL